MSTRSIGRLGACFGGCARAFATVPALAEDASATRSAATAGAIVHTEDVDLFYRIYDAADGHPTAEQLQHDYLDQGSDGLQVLARERNVTGQRIADMLAQNPSLYTGAKRFLAVLPPAPARLEPALHKLGRLYPDARFPPVPVAARPSGGEGKRGA